MKQLFKINCKTPLEKVSRGQKQAKKVVPKLSQSCPEQAQMQKKP